MSHSRQDVLPVKPSPLDSSFSAGDRIALEEKVFKRMIAVERKRTERSQAPFVLMLMEMNGHHESR